MGHDETFTLTRRRTLQAGGAAAVLLANPWVARAAAQGSGDAAGYLQRSAYRDLTNPDFAVGNTTLRLEHVVDLPSATLVPALRDSEDAFALVFTGPGVGRLAAGIHEVRHSELGRFYLYVSQVGAPGDERIEVVVNRVLSNSESRRTPPRAPRNVGAAGGDQRRASDSVGTPAEGDAKSTIRSISVKRGKRGARCVVKLDGDADVRELTAWLRRGDRVVAATTRRVKRARVEFNLKSAKRLRKGGYEVVLLATAADGEQSYRAKLVTLR